jgi:hypothetical protein
MMESACAEMHDLAKSAHGVVGELQRVKFVAGINYIPYYSDSVNEFERNVKSVATMCYTIVNMMKGWHWDCPPSFMKPLIWGTALKSPPTHDKWGKLIQEKAKAPAPETIERDGKKKQVKMPNIDSAAWSRSLDQMQLDADGLQKLGFSQEDAEKIGLPWKILDLDVPLLSSPLRVELYMPLLPSVIPFDTHIHCDEAKKEEEAKNEAAKQASSPQPQGAQAVFAEATKQAQTFWQDPLGAFEQGWADCRTFLENIQAVGSRRQLDDSVPVLSECPCKAKPTRGTDVYSLGATFAALDGDGSGDLKAAELTASGLTVVGSAGSWNVHGVRYGSGAVEDSAAANQCTIERLIKATGDRDTMLELDEVYERIAYLGTLRSPTGSVSIWDWIPSDTSPSPCASPTQPVATVTGYQPEDIGLTEMVILQDFSVKRATGFLLYKVENRSLTAQNLDVESGSPPADPYDASSIYPVAELSSDSIIYDFDPSSSTYRPTPFLSQNFGVMPPLLMMD